VNTTKTHGPPKVSKATTADDRLMASSGVVGSINRVV
jgi:hypothetical protein